jgi:transglutaminase-like putative cysteine protease
MVGTTWFTVSLMDQRAGYASSSVEVQEPEGGPRTLRVVDRLQAQLRLAEGAEPLKLTQEVSSTFDESLRPLRMSSVSDEFGRRREVEAEVNGDGLDVVVRAGGSETRKHLDLTPEFGSDILLPMDVAAGRVAIGETRSVDVFNPELVALDRMSITVDESLTLEDGRAAYRARVRSGLLPIETTVVVTTDGDTVLATTESLLKLTMRQVTEEEALEAAAPLVLSSRIVTNRKIDDPKRLEQLTARLSAGTQPASEIVPNTPRQTVTTGDNQALLTVRRLSVEGPSTTLPIAGEEFTPYLTPSEISQFSDPRILAKAREIVGDETDARKAAARIVMWVYDHVEKVASEPRLISALEILDEMRGDCTEHAILCGALAQAAGIPARMLAGIAYARGSFYYHAWNLLYVGEWVEMDATWGELAPDAGHIRLADAALDPKSMAGLGLAAGRCLGVLQVEIIDAQTVPVAAQP